MKVFFLALLVIMHVVSAADAVTVVLKSGRKLNVDYVDDTGSKYVCYFANGMNVGFRKDEVVSVEKIDPINATLQTASSLPFVFDNWTSGMTLSQTFHTARDQDLPLVVFGRESSGTGYDPQLAEAFGKDGRHFYYKTKLLKQTCLVTLHFTPKGTLLSDVQVRWEHISKSQEYLLEIKDLLVEKYASPQKETATVYGRSYLWLPNKNVQILLESIPGGVNLVYLDREMCMQRDLEEAALAVEHKQKFSAQDKSKL